MIYNDNQSTINKVKDDYYKIYTFYIYGVSLAFTHPVPIWRTSVLRLPRLRDEFI